MLDKKTKECLISSINKKWISPLEAYMALSPSNKREAEREPYTYDTSTSEDEYEGNNSKFQNKICKSSMLTIVKNFNYLVGKSEDLINARFKNINSFPPLIKFQIKWFSFKEIQVQRAPSGVVKTFR